MMKSKKRKVLITGADGFIGSHLVEACLEYGYQVRAFVYYNSFNSLGWLDTLSQDVLDKLEIISGDIRDYGAIQTAVQGVDDIFHLAALIGIPFSYYSPESYVETNIKGTLNVLQAARCHPIKRILVTSTSEVYGTATYVPIDEKHPLQAQSPYSASKIGADHLAKSFYCSFDLPVTIVRPFNTYGPRQSARAVIPTIIMQLLESYDEIKLGSLDPVRDFNYVKDVSQAFIKIANNSSTIGETIHIATGKSYRIKDIVEILVKKINPKARIILDQQRLRPSNSEVYELCGSFQKIQKLTGWNPEYDIDTGLQETIQWFQDNLQHYKADKYYV